MIKYSIASTSTSETGKQLTSPGKKKKKTKTPTVFLKWRDGKGDGDGDGDGDEWMNMSSLREGVCKDGIAHMRK